MQEAPACSHWPLASKRSLGRGGFLRALRMIHTHPFSFSPLWWHTPHVVSTAVKTQALKLGLPGFKFHFRPWLGVTLSGTQTPLCLSFFNCKTELVLIPIS